MMDFLINHEELAALSGLPHIQQLVYLRGIRPYMDVKSGIVGIKRRISHQSLAEQLYIEPHPGIKSQCFSRDQVRRAVLGLVRAGAISIESADMHLILTCQLATRDFSVQNKAAINPPQKSAIKAHTGSQIDGGLLAVMDCNNALAEPTKAATPLNKDNLYLFLCTQFEKFWSLYPEKRSKHKAQAVFAQLNPDEKLCNRIIDALTTQIKYREGMALHANWMPPWKYPENWLAQRCWEDEFLMDALLERPYANDAKHNRNHDKSTDLFCPPDEYDEPAGNNVILFKRSK